MMKSTLLILILVSFILSLVNAHAVMVFPPPRDGEEVEPGLKINNFPPTSTQLNACVGVGKTAGNVKATLEEGSSVTVKWKITIAHQVDKNTVNIALVKNWLFPFRVILEFA
ncbi:hypothetical protein HK096_006587 [Nowakowskiella sp. JEL0078]|nr:hypothetical protein HK096_006587 [Nowakowskiella sp. JEL0078]